MATEATPPPTTSWNLRDPAQLLATGFGAGLLPVAPGTWGSLAALPAGWLIVTAGGWWALAAAAALASVIGLWASDRCVARHGIQDPGPVVIDEIAGQWLVLLAAPVDVIHYLVAFAVFRLFDILKPWPVSWADRELKGGFGIMVDDLLAGAYGIAVMLGVAAVMG